MGVSFVGQIGTQYCAPGLNLAPPGHLGMGMGTGESSLEPNVKAKRRAFLWRVRLSEMLGLPLGHARRSASSQVSLRVVVQRFALIDDVNSEQLK